MVLIEILCLHFYNLYIWAYALNQVCIKRFVSVIVFIIHIINSHSQIYLIYHNRNGLFLTKMPHLLFILPIYKLSR